MESMSLYTIGNGIESNFSNENTTTITATKNGEEEEATTENISRPRFINLDTSDDPAVFKPIIDVSAEGFVPHDTIFKVMTMDVTGRNIEVALNATVLMGKYWPREIMITMVEAGNAFRANRLKQEPDLRMWLDKRNTRPFTLACMYQFIAMLYYFGITQLPCKNDY